MRELASSAGDRRPETGDRIGLDEGGAIGVRVAVQPSALTSLLESLAADARFVAYPTLGVVRLRLKDESDLPALTAMGGIVEDAPPEVKRRIDVFGPAPSSLPLMRAVKAQLDPNGVLSPGRFVGRL